MAVKTATTEAKPTFVGSVSADFVSVILRLGTELLV